MFRNSDAHASNRDTQNRASSEAHSSRAEQAHLWRASKSVSSRRRGKPHSRLGRYPAPEIVGLDRPRMAAFQLSTEDNGRYHVLLRGRRFTARHVETTAAAHPRRTHRPMIRPVRPPAVPFAGTPPAPRTSRGGSYVRPRVRGPSRAESTPPSGAPPDTYRSAPSAFLPSHCSRRSHQQ